MNAACVSLEQLDAHCRANRQGTPAGDLRDPALMAELIGMIRDERLRELQSRAQPPSHERWDSVSGRVVATVPAVPAPDPREDGLACQLQTLIGFLDDLAAGPPGRPQKPATA
jgi:hypothetical protein